ncbi:SPOR domain-containing protein [Roseospira visakhapatnamensis]|uniref:SPOR domain-containing protein n=1 Tax=Roseospira visakhapatnamensis TaxID=390880 RepID=A0A7W6RBP7_9PROT|nr:SPOR domain-containing protein [Roseospira visakhapatnamensis]MBB4265539.1 hypothetical protein [Roseospira visakhapatnamensis]
MPDQNCKATPTRHHPRRRTLPLAFALPAALLMLAGCAVGEGGMVEVVSPPAASIDSALAALARGNRPNADAWTDRALRETPGNPYALLVRGLLAERAAQPGLARESYQAILAQDPDELIAPTPLDLTAQPRRVAEVAAERLRGLSPSAVGPGMARVPGVSGPTALQSPTARPTPAVAPSGSARTNVARRFEILERLAREGMISGEEYRTHRAANLGALMPLTQAPPSVGLTRPPPRDTAVIARLRDLGRTFESGAISAGQHAEERRAILDALLPAQPTAREAPLTRPSGAAAQRHAQRLEDTLRRGLITIPEYEAERAALAAAGVRGRGAPRPAPAVIGPGGGMTPAISAMPSPPTPGETAQDTPEGDAGTAAPSGAATAPRLLVPPVPSEPGITAGPPTANAEDPATQRFTGVTNAPPGASDAEAAATRGSGNYVHLASYRDETSARAGWAALSQRYAGSMRDMAPHYQRVTVPGKGTFIRLKAGPVGIPGGANRLCDQLRGAGQFCEPTTLLE